MSRLLRPGSRAAATEQSAKRSGGLPPKGAALDLYLTWLL